MYQRKIVTFFSLIIIIFAVLGLMICGAAFYFIARVEIPSISSTQLVTTLEGTVSSVSSLVKESSDALGNVSNTVEEARISLKEASDMLYSSSGDLVEIAEAIDFEFLGIRPLSGVSDYFFSISSDLETLSASVEEMADSVGVNVEDLDNISLELLDMSKRMDGFSDSFGVTTNTMPDFDIKTVAYVILVFMSLQNMVIALIGISLFALNKKPRE